jgi:hypothetical protein
LLFRGNAEEARRVLLGVATTVVGVLALTLGELRRTAAAYRTEAEIMTGMGHGGMVARLFGAATAHIGGWLADQLQVASASRGCCCVRCDRLGAATLAA